MSGQAPRAGKVLRAAAIPIVIWLMVGGKALAEDAVEQVGTTVQATGPVEEAVEQVTDVVEATTEQVTDAVEETTGEVEGTTDAVEEATGQVADAVKDNTEQIGTTAQSTTEGVEATVEGTAGTAQAAAQEVSEPIDPDPADTLSLGGAVVSGKGGATKDRGGRTEPRTRGEDNEDGSAGSHGTDDPDEGTDLEDIVTIGNEIFSDQPEGEEEKSPGLGSGALAITGAALLLFLVMSASMVGAGGTTLLGARRTWRRSLTRG